MKTHWHGTNINTALVLTLELKINSGLIYILLSFLAYQILLLA